MAMGITSFPASRMSVVLNDGQRIEVPMLDLHMQPPKRRPTGWPERHVAPMPGMFDVVTSTTFVAAPAFWRACGVPADAPRQQMRITWTERSADYAPKRKRPWVVMLNGSAICSRKSKGNAERIAVRCGGVVNRAGAGKTITTTVPAEVKGCDDTAKGVVVQFEIVGPMSVA